MRSLTLTLTLLLTLVICRCTSGSDTNEQAYNEYVAAYTNGTISRQSNVCVVFSENIRQSRIDSLNASDVMHIDPSADGQFSFTDNHTLVFTPQNEMQRNTHYTVTVDIGEIFDNGDDFKFSFQTKPFALRGSFYTLNIANDDSYEVIWNITTPDTEPDNVVEKHIKISEQCDTSWTHQPDGQTHRLTTKFKPTNKVNLKVIAIADKALDIDETDIASIELPSSNELAIVDTKGVPGDRQCIEISFNQILDPKQDITGLAYVKGKQCSVSSENNKLRIYIDNNNSSNQGVEIFISKAIRSKRGLQLDKDIEMSFGPQSILSNDKPTVEFVGDGTIIPQSERILIPFRSVHMKGVRVMVFKIFSNMIGTLLQQGSINDYDNLALAGRPVAATTFYMDESGVDLNTWHTFAVDLTNQFKVEPGAMYRIELSLDARLSAWPCDTLPKATKEELAAEDQLLLKQMGSEFDRNCYYYTGKAYDSYEWYDGYYRDRENPSAKCYYDNKSVGKNVLATNIGLSAFKGTDNNLRVTAINLPDAQPLSDVEIEAYSMQLQLLGKGNTDNNGIANLELNEILGQPMYIMARLGSDVSYLKVKRGTELSTSTFDVSGNVIQNGLKGYIYGDRGVWRPGDTMYLSFMLNDKNKTLPANHPITLQLTNPLGQVVQNLTKTNGVMGIYSFSIPLDENAPTGTWTACIKVGGVSFSKNLRVETIKPNRLKIDIKLPDILENGTNAASLHTEWLNGNIANGLKYDVSTTVIETKTSWKNLKGFVFDDPTKSFETIEQNVAKGEVGSTGNASLALNFNLEKNSPGMLKCNITTKVYEPSGEFSTDAYQTLISPYSRYIGIKSPQTEKQSHLDTDKNQTFTVVSVDKNGKTVPYVNLEVKVYKVNWYWWWSATRSDLVGYTSSSYHTPVKTMKVQTESDGGCTFNLNISENNWGTYLIRVEDINGGHSTGILSYFDWPWMTSRQSDNDRDNATVLSISTDKKEYTPGDKMHINIPSSEGSTAILSISNGSHILKFDTYQCQKDGTTIDVEITDEMMPNAFVSISLVQPYEQTTNDMPIRLYGIVPISVTSAKSHLNPIIGCDDEIKPESKCSITVSEKDGRPMAYTLAIVDEGLLDLTHFRTPNAWDTFNAREAMGIRMWDLYGHINGAFGGRIEQTFSIGGDEALNNGPKAIVNRFTPMVYFAGPFMLKDGQKRKHDIDVPNYNGRVRVMVVAGDGEAYGNAEKSVLVRRSLMIIGTMPRQIGVNDEMTVSATIFASKKVGKVNVSIDANNGLSVIGDKTNKISFDAAGDKTVQFRVKANNKNGMGSVVLRASSSDDKVEYPVEICIRSVSQTISKTTSERIEAGKTWSQKVSIPGDDSYKLYVEASSNQPLNISNRLNSLLTYPHGCVEQTTSKMFPQLYLSDFAELSPVQTAEVENNIKNGIDRLRTYQTSDGGMAYWSGSNYSNMWASAYVLNFLTEASGKGYFVPDDMLRNLKKYVKNMVRKWKNNNRNDESFSTAYSLYALAKAQNSEMGTMNRMKECAAELDANSIYMLSAAYSLSSRTDVAQQLLTQPATKWHSYWCTDNVLKLIAQTLCTDNNASATANEVRQTLMSNQWLSTSETAHSLVAMSAFYKKNAASSGLKFTASVGDKKAETIESDKYVWTTSAQQSTNEAKVTVKNNSNTIMYLDVTAQGIATQSHVSQSSNGLEVSVRYLSDNGSPINVANISQSTTFKAYVSVRNISGTDLQHVAITHIVPSGWEILSTASAENISYQDRRDDRMLAYADKLQNGETATIVLNLSATYSGHYYMPSISAEAMYDNTISGCTESGTCDVK